MKVMIGSIVVVGLLVVGLWLLLSPAFGKVGDAAQKVSSGLKGDKKDE